MKHKTQIQTLGFAALLLVASARTSVAAPKHTGIQGQATLTISYGLGVEVAPGIWIAPPSVSLPVTASFAVLSARTGQQVAHVTTERDGSYQLALHPGSYVLVPEDITLLGGCSVSVEPVEVTVHAHQFTTANLCYFRLGPCSIQASPAPTRASREAHWGQGSALSRMASSSGSGT